MMMIRVEVGKPMERIWILMVKTQIHLPSVPVAVESRVVDEVRNSIAKSVER
jgi:hypothetical protein